MVVVIIVFFGFTFFLLSKKKPEKKIPRKEDLNEFLQENTNHFYEDDEGYIPIYSKKKKDE